MTTEFKEALEQWKSIQNGIGNIISKKNGDFILRALKIADRLMQEPSDGMADALRDEYTIYRGPMHIEFSKQLIKAMRDQILKEIEE